MLRMGLAPCAPFNVTQDLMVAAAKLARQHEGVRLHTHLAENIEDIEYMEKTFKCRPGEYIRSVDNCCCSGLMRWSSCACCVLLAAFSKIIRSLHCTSTAVHRVHRRITA